MTYRVFIDNDETLRIRGAGHLLGASPDVIEKAVTGCAQPKSAERAGAVNAKDNLSATGDGA